MGLMKAIERFKTKHPISGDNTLEVHIMGRARQNPIFAAHRASSIQFLGFRQNRQGQREAEILVMSSFIYKRRHSLGNINAMLTRASKEINTRKTKIEKRPDVFPHEKSRWKQEIHYFERVKDTLHDVANKFLAPTVK